MWVGGMAPYGDVRGRKVSYRDIDNNQILGCVSGKAITAKDVVMFKTKGTFVSPEDLNTHKIERYQAVTETECAFFTALIQIASNKLLSVEDNKLRLCIE